MWMMHVHCAFRSEFMYLWPPSWFIFILLLYRQTRLFQNKQNHHLNYYRTVFINQGCKIWQSSSPSGWHYLTFPMHLYYVCAHNLAYYQKTFKRTQTSIMTSGPKVPFMKLSICTAQCIDKMYYISACKQLYFYKSKTLVKF